MAPAPSPVVESTGPSTDRFRDRSVHPEPAGDGRSAVPADDSIPTGSGTDGSAAEADPPHTAVFDTAAAARDDGDDPSPVADTDPVTEASDTERTDTGRGVSVEK